MMISDQNTDLLQWEGEENPRLRGAICAPLLSRWLDILKRFQVRY